MVDVMDSLHAQNRWKSGYTLLMIPPFIGLAIILFDLPRWVEMVGVALILLLVGAGSGLLRSRAGGWRPSETLGEGRDDAR